MLALRLLSHATVLSMGCSRISMEEVTVHQSDSPLLGLMNQSMHAPLRPRPTDLAPLICQATELPAESQTASHSLFPVCHQPATCRVGNNRNVAVHTRTLPTTLKVVRHPVNYSPEPSTGRDSGVQSNNEETDSKGLVWLGWGWGGSRPQLRCSAPATHTTGICQGLRHWVNLTSAPPPHPHSLPVLSRKVFTLVFKGDHVGGQAM